MSLASSAPVRELVLRIFPDITVAARAHGKINAAHRILALHGWLDNAASFDFLAPRLLAAAAQQGVDAELVAVDFVGHGLSSWKSPSSPYYGVEYVDHTIRAADALGWPTFQLIGHSMGGTVATALASTFPERVERLLALEGYAVLHKDPSSATTTLREAITSRKVLAAKTPRRYSNVEEAAAARIATVHRLPGRQTLSMGAAMALVTRGTRKEEDSFIFRHDLQLQAKALMYHSPPAAESLLRGIACDTMVILAEHGWPYGSTTRGMLNHVKRLQVHSLDHASHHLHMDPDCVQRVADLAIPFLLSPAFGAG